MNKKIEQSELNDAFQSLKKKGIVTVGTTTQYTAVKISDNEVEKVLAVHDLDNGLASVFTYSEDKKKWFPTPFVGDIAIKVT
ncbi:hypothetical protein [Shewanella sp. GutDb-MelDb]|uniref:hypothetical protein n=1 Tax=Shewanella sp. GutDb-MelDb TaxID=2058316 RepID=UPI000C7E7AA6|nr:hypothetical protein [Shewanella sp. GutDb-MelDb]PKG57724.1 hypothetical protein CXF82_08090 [Shewanella sp. GutDb-MelDb]